MGEKTAKAIGFLAMFALLAACAGPPPMTSKQAATVSKACEDVGMEVWIHGGRITCSTIGAEL